MLISSQTCLFEVHRIFLLFEVDRVDLKAHAILLIWLHDNVSGSFVTGRSWKTCPSNCVCQMVSTMVKERRFVWLSFLWTPMATHLYCFKRPYSGATDSTLELGGRSDTKFVLYWFCSLTNPPSGPLGIHWFLIRLKNLMVSFSSLPRFLLGLKLISGILSQLKLKKSEVYESDWHSEKLDSLFALAYSKDPSWMWLLELGLCWRHSQPTPGASCHYSCLFLDRTSDCDDRNEPIHDSLHRNIWFHDVLLWTEIIIHFNSL